MYVHVPWCRSRCGYCDFNTYVPGSLAGVGPDSFVGDAVAELGIARAAVGGDRELPVSTVFVGGGTPTMLEPGELVRVLHAIDSEFGLASDAEVTTEANPETVTPETLSILREGGFTRVSFGMQSAVEHVLAVLDREHTPGRAIDAVAWAKAAGFEEVSVDLIYGAPGESDADWQRSLDAAVGVEPTHVSAYSLIVESGTRLARQVSAGVYPMPDEDVLARRYEMADATFRDAGLDWYEVSNWARGGPQGPSTCRHNMGYWHNDDWWGVGPGAHSHIGGVRFWNVKHPGRYSGLVRAGRSPQQGSEQLTATDQQLEAVMLGLRLAEGIPVSSLADPGTPEISALVDEGLLDSNSLAAQRLTLTPAGRLLADLAIRRLT